MISRLIIFLVVMLNVIGCADRARFTPEDFCASPEKPDMARMIFTRTYSIFGAASALGIFDNDQPIGRLDVGDTVCWDRFPGKAIITGRNAFDDRSHEGWVTTVDAKAGKAYIVKGSIVGEWSWRER